MLSAINSSNHSDLESSLQRSGEEMTHDMNTTLRSELAALQYKWNQLFAEQVDLPQLEEELLDIDKDRLAIEETNLNKSENLQVENEAQVDLLQLKEEPLDISNGDNEKDPLEIEETDIVKSENVEVEDKVASRFTTTERGTA
ncbi:uncharacterized protein LOC142333735 isoform X2 [Lycorma delicatula]|uniref:uncharacterized protein LOC142333735 isoform X2 n=1 Tax=Lycorma delicatula TaxID=130591 RepID=UPI003F5194D7